MYMRRVWFVYCF